MVDENACKSFVEHQEFLAMKAQKKASERNTLPNIDWNNEDHVSSLTAQVKIVLQATQFTGQWRESNASSSCSTLRSGCSTNTGTRRH